MTLDVRPTLTLSAIRRWVPALARRAPDLLSAYLLPGRVPARDARGHDARGDLGQPVSSLRACPRAMGSGRRAPGA